MPITASRAPIPTTASGKLDDSMAAKVGFNGFAGGAPQLAPAARGDAPGDALLDAFDGEGARGGAFGAGVGAAGVPEGAAEGVPAGGGEAGEGGGGAEPGLTASPLICFNTLLPAPLPGQDPSESYVYTQYPIAPAPCQ